MSDWALTGGLIDWLIDWSVDWSELYTKCIAWKRRAGRAWRHGQCFGSDEISFWRTVSPHECQAYSEWVCWCMCSEWSLVGVECVDWLQYQVCQGLSETHEDLQQSSSRQWRRTLRRRIVTAGSVHRSLLRLASLHTCAVSPITADFSEPAFASNTRNTTYSFKTLSWMAYIAHIAHVSHEFTKKGISGPVLSCRKLIQRTLFLG